MSTIWSQTNPILKIELWNMVELGSKIFDPQQLISSPHSKYFLNFNFISDDFKVRILVDKLDLNVVSYTWILACIERGFLVDLEPIYMLHANL